VFNVGNSEPLFSLTFINKCTQVHYSTDGWLLHNSSDEAKKQNDLQKLEAELTAKFQVIALDSGTTYAFVSQLSEH
jgi:hypothetical protein